MLVVTIPVDMGGEGNMANQPHWIHWKSATIYIFFYKSQYENLLILEKWTLKFYKKYFFLYTILMCFFAVLLKFCTAISIYCLKFKFIFILHEWKAWNWYWAFLSILYFYFLSSEFFKLLFTETFTDPEYQCKAEN